MPIEFEFEYDRDNDVVIARPSGQLDCEADIDTWCREYERYFTSNFNRKMDVILDLTGFSVDPHMGARFGERRAGIIKRFFERSYRVKTEPGTRIFSRTSSVIHGATDNDFPSVEAALDALRSERAAPQEPAGRSRPANRVRRHHSPSSRTTRRRPRRS